MAEAFGGNGVSTGENLDEAEVLRRYEEKRRLLESMGKSVEKKEVFREAFRETVYSMQSSSTIPPVPPPITNVLPKTFPVTENTEAELESLIKLALTEGVISAAKKAQAETPYLIDALHDELADHYYDELIRNGKIAAE